MLASLVWSVAAVAALIVSIFVLDVRRRRLGMLVTFITALVAVYSWIPSQPDLPPPPGTSDTDARESTTAHTPRQRPVDGYVSSQSCEECHPRQFNTWHASYHRTMTQRATPAAVFGDFDNRQVEFQGVSYTLSRRGDEFRVAVSRNDGIGTARRTVEHPVVLTTGSHHMQVYWVPTGNGRTLAELPIYYLKNEQRWVPRDASFLTVPSPDPNALEVGRWNQECIQCHTTHGRSRPRTNNGELAADSEVAEFGIACEACHGPAEQHVKSRRDGDVPDKIVNPGRLTSKLSAQVCGRCHSITLTRRQSEMPDLMEHGYQFRPGDVLTDTLHLFQRDQATRDRLKAGILSDDRHLDTAMDMQFWSDGMVRVSGREFNGLVRSACYQQGEMSCVSCHVLHQPAGDSRAPSEWADDQLRLDALGDKACTQCHSDDRYAAQSHTHHAAGSSGSRCYNCHMPHTTYGLLKAIRSHTIDSPDAGVSVRTGRPNACNLCHLDRTLDWTAQQLQQWYGVERPQLSEDQRAVSAAALGALQGDAGQRVLIAWHMGWEPAKDASGQEWLAPYLAALLDDPYPAVRFNAARSLHQLPGFADFDYDFVGTAGHRAAAAGRALEIWKNNQPQNTGPRHRVPEHVLLSPDGSLQQAAFDRLRRQRDDKPVRLAE